MRTAITAKVLERLQPKDKPYFIRSTKTQGFALKVNTSGSIMFIAETKYQGKTYRKTLGKHPIISIKEAELEARRYLHHIHSGDLQKQREDPPLEVLFSNYIHTIDLKPNTLRNYREVVSFYLADWLKKPISNISKQMVENRFLQIRDKGINGGIPTYSQATKTMRILSALMNYARADDLINVNPVEVLKLKRIDRSTRKRENYLKASEVRKLLEETLKDNHPVTLAIHLMLYSGLRKNEALRLKWEDLTEVEGISVIIISDTKNHRPHYIPVSSKIKETLERAENNTRYIFPSTQKKDSCAVDVRPTTRRLSQTLGIPFKCHDLRRSFATRASEAGLDFLMIKRLLNHKSNDITAQYIQWNSKQNLEAMRYALERINY